jgi:hypothetical protein
MVNNKNHFILLFMLIISGCAEVYKGRDLNALYGPSVPKQRLLNEQVLLHYQEQQKVSYYQDIKPILDSRCVACHACYDAPCQLKMSSFEGLDRGASKRKIYDSSRMSPASPTRLFTDATDTEGWRKRQFFPVLNERSDTNTANLDNALLAKLLQLKRNQPLPETGKLDSQFSLELNRKEECPTIEKFDLYQQRHPQWGMPYALPGLSLEQEYTVMSWLQEGARVEPLPVISKQAQANVKKWESWFNRPDKKQQLVSRYIYEHLFVGHLYFEDDRDAEFFQLIRSKTPPGQGVEEIISTRPYDDPGVPPFYYRLRHYAATIVDKIHFVYPLNANKMQRYEQLFIIPDYDVSVLPSYQTRIAANPFLVFQDIPLYSRHRFLLDNAQFFVSGFIKGPVCRGQTALNSIHDRFWLFFSTPMLEYQDEVIKFQADNFYLLNLPGEEGDDIGLFDFLDFDALGAEYMRKKDEFISRILPEKDLSLDLVWDGDGENTNAALTVFRHFDSATVAKGFIGTPPLTGWFVDYPIFERLHYLLVAGFNVYGSAGHQIASRFYMDILRQDAENNFLRLLPAESRQKVYDSWYQGVNGPRKLEPLFNGKLQSGIEYKTDNHKQELFAKIKAKLGKAAGNFSRKQCIKTDCEGIETLKIQQQIDTQIAQLAALKGHQLAALPELSLLRIKTADPKNDRVYSLVVNKALSNISIAIGEDYRRTPEYDTLTVFPGFIGSYPNFFFSVRQQKIPQFVEMLSAASEKADRELFYKRFGIRRTHPEIWDYYDWFNQQHKNYRGLSAGLLDLSRYHNL